MAVCVISTVGQSVITNQSQDIKEAIREFSKQSVDLESIRSDSSKFAGENLHSLVLNALQSRSNDLAMLRRASAEINSLTRILENVPNDQNDVLHFVASETPDGVLAARILADFCMDYFERDTEVHIVRGLQVSDGQRFRREGLRNLIRLTYSLLENAHDSVYSRLINPTGGFKGVVPYLTIIGMLQPSVEMRYIYEQSPELITLSGLPLKLDTSKLSVDVLRQISIKSTLSEPELRELLDDHRSVVDQPIWAFLDAETIGEDTVYSLNGLGEIALQELYVEQAMPVYLSQQAKARLDKASAGSEERRNYEKILSQIHDAGLRQNNMHTYANPANAYVYKLSRQNERAFYLVKQDHILVLEFAQHLPDSSYDTVPTRAQDYGQHTRWSKEQAR